MTARINAKTLLIAAVVAVLLALAGVGGIAYATGGNSDPSQSTGPGMKKAKSVALDYTNGGRVSETEFKDEEGYYQIEVTRNDGTKVDVNLDRNYNVLNAPADNEGSDSNDAQNN